MGENECLFGERHRYLSLFYGLTIPRDYALTGHERAVKIKLLLQLELKEKSKPALRVHTASQRMDDL